MTKKAKYKYIDSKDFEMHKRLLEYLSIGKVSKITGRGYNTISRINSVNSLKEYHELVTSENMKRKQATTKSSVDAVEEAGLEVPGEAPVEMPEDVQLLQDVVTRLGQIEAGLNAVLRQLDDQAQPTAPTRSRVRIFS